MAMVAGDAEDENETELAGLIAINMKAAFGKKFSVKSSKKFINVMAESIIEYIKDNAEVSVTVGLSEGSGTIS